MEKISTGIYVRVSDKEQVSGWSIGAQWDECREWIERNRPDLRVTRKFTDPGYPAGTLERPGVAQLFEAIDRKKISCLVVWKYDRLSRDDVDFPSLMWYFQKRGVEVISISEPALDYNTAHGSLIINILGAVSSFERKQNAMRVKMGMRARCIENGLWHGGKPSYGYVYVPETGRLAIEPTEAENVRLMFRLYLETGCVNAVRKELIKRGIFTRSGTKFNTSYLYGILQRPRYIGEQFYMGQSWSEPSLRIISDPLFEEVKQALHENKWQRA